MYLALRKCKNDCKMFKITLKLLDLPSEFHLNIWAKFFIFFELTPFRMSVTFARRGGG